MSAVFVLIGNACLEHVTQRAMHVNAVIRKRIYPTLTTFSIYIYKCAYIYTEYIHKYTEYVYIYIEYVYIYIHTEFVYI